MLRPAPLRSWLGRNWSSVSDRSASEPRPSGSGLLTFLLAAVTLAYPAVLRDGNRISIPDSTGGTIVEFASPTSLQYERWFGPNQPTRGAPLSLITLPLTLTEISNGAIQFT